MPRIATWIRAKDQDLFARSFAFAPEVELRDARLGPVEIEDADALLLTGGGDIAAGSLQQDVPRPSPLRGVDRGRDAWEFPAVWLALARGLPILAICRGHQVLNVALAGTLHLDIKNHNQPKAQAAADLQILHYAAGVPASRTFARVNSSHHQAVDRPGDNLEVEAWCAADGMVEQVRHHSHPWCIGVQYHPERSAGYEPLFRAFVESIRPRRVRAQPARRRQI
jgi:putative glutamine amidotransferase